MVEATSETHVAAHIETDAEKQRRKLKETMESIERSKKLLAHIKEVSQETEDTTRKTKEQAATALASAKRVVNRKAKQAMKYEGELKVLTAKPLNEIKEDEDYGDESDEDY